MALVLLQRKNSKLSDQIGKREFLEALREAIKFSGWSQSDFARRIGLGTSAFSFKINGKRGNSFTAPEIRLMLLTLAELQGINRRDELLYLLKLAGLREATFSQADWQQEPLKLLD